MRLKMHQGTTSTSQGTLCSRCRYAQMIRMAHSNEQRTICHQFGETTQIHGSVAECNRFDDCSQPTLHAMREIAWHVNSDPAKGVIGFISAKERRRKAGGERDEGDQPLVTPDGEVYY